MGAHVTFIAPGRARGRGAGGLSVESGHEPVRSADVRADDNSARIGPVHVVLFSLKL